MPVLWHTVTEARPDLPSGLAIGLAAGAIAHRSVLDRSARALAGLGIACGLAVSIKPTSFFAVLALFGSAFAIRLFVDCIGAGGSRISIRRAVGALLWLVLPLIATTAVLIGPAFVETVTYILTVFVGQRGLWTTAKVSGPDYCAAVLIAYAIPSVAELKTYFFGAMFYGVFIVAMVLNGCTSLV